MYGHIPMTALVFLILCSLKFKPVHCQAYSKLSVTELPENKFTCTVSSNQQLFGNGLRTGTSRCSSVTANRSNRSPSTNSLEQKNIQYKSCAIRTVSCDPNFKYRSVDGSCNNLNNPTWGMANTTYLRVLPAHYKNDSTNLPPVSTSGQPLPSARLLSSVFFPDVNRGDKRVSLVGMQWGQFIAHDIALDATLSNSDQINCCDQTTSKDTRICLPISIPSNDPFYARFNITCQNMVRNAFILSPNCSGTAEQFNLVSHFLDGTHIYGSDSNVANRLREFKSGRLLIQTCSDGKDFLPSMDSASSCNHTTDGIRFVAGDTRVNQNPQLTILHTLFVREHNRIVDELQQLHTDWSDEILYQEARSIVIAELQHITYNEWLPLILGKKMMNKYGLYSSQHRNFTYDKHLIPVTTNSFASSAFRVGHSAIQGNLSLFSSYSECPVRSFNISNLLDHPDIILQQGIFDEFTRGLTKQSMQKIDNFHTDQITQQLFHEDKPFGTDLLSTDIQRGRDHGIPPYVAFLRLCTGFQPQNFTELRKFIPPQFIQQLQEYYASVDDTELFIGGLLEKPSPGGRVGATFGCIIAEQFTRYKYGDRFWYEIRGQQHSFTNRQLHEIKKATLSRIICDNSNNIVNIAPKSFSQLSDRNSVVPCSSLPSVNINGWK